MTMCTKICNLIILSTVLLCLSACESKEFKANENSKSKVVDDLNRGDSDQVIKSLSGKENDADETFYLASAYASKGGIDIYSMYPLLELRLFHEKAINWSDMGKNDNKYFKILSKRPDLKEKTPEEREKVWDNSSSMIKKRFGIEKDFECYDGIAKEYCLTLLDEKESIVSKAIETNNFDNHSFYDRFHNIMREHFDENDTSWDDRNDFYRVEDKVVNYLVNELQYESSRQDFIHPQAVGEFTEADSTLIFMNILWMTYEAIPLLKSLPEVSLDQQGDITNAIIELEKISQDKEYKLKANTFIYSLSLFSLLSIYSTSFDFDRVESPTDLSCQFKPEKLVEYYPILKVRFQTLLRHAKDANLDPEVLKSIEPYMSYLDTLPEYMEEEAKLKFIEGIKLDQEESCSIESLL